MQFLFDCICRGDVEKVAELFCSSGMSVNVCDDKGRTPLHIACSRGQTKMVNFLLSLNADIDVEDFLRNTPLHLASISGNSEVVSLLLKKALCQKKNINEVLRHDITRKTPLNWAISRLQRLKSRINQEDSNSFMILREELQEIIDLFFQFLELLKNEQSNNKKPGWDEQIYMNTLEETIQYCAHRAESATNIEDILMLESMLNTLSL